MKLPKYSVLMSVYIKEDPNYFEESIISMIKQTIIPDEIIIVKDGPLTNELDDIIDKYVSLYPNTFNILPLKYNVGLGPALTEGLKIAKNKLVARMDTDDISIHDRCEKQLICFAKNPEISICGGMIEEFKDTVDNVFSTRLVPLEHENILNFSRRRSPFNHVTVMFNKDDVLSTDGGYHDVPRKEDIDLFVRMLNKGFIGKNLNETLVLVRSDDDYYERRKSWTNCSSYIRVIYNFWKQGYSSTFDLIYVTFTQIGMFLSPIWLLKIVSDKFLRVKMNKETNYQVVKKNNK